ncbi:MAG: DUF1223 domain-containing protein [Candidatus Thioglobus sp.]|nr:MAG: DUF1223 domain-containing protein [Candidatus Thioglobus sp.]
MRLSKILPLLLLSLFADISFGKNLHFESGNTQNTMVELYTSEGCSSCPPADEWFSGFKHHPQLFSEIVPIAFHVDYWDYIGWEDEFANSAYSKRQTQYRQQGNIRQIYTPQVVKNGKDDRTFRYTHSLQNQITGKLSVDVLDDTVNISFNAKQQPLVANVALLGFGLESSVTAGENEDKILKHDFVVLGHQQKTANGNHWSIKLPQSSKPAKRFALAVWVNTPNSLKPIQVIGSWL